ncbi:MAG: type IV pilin protein [Gammaproteobacteria bacterium]|nr:type IV pilin protein [Gammaproteobacteria bacterium]
MSPYINDAKQHGITLIELMIVVAIIGILAAIAYPSYQEYIIRANRADAQGALTGLGAAMERHYTQNGSYTAAAAGGADTGAPAIYATQSPVDGGNAVYNLEIAAANATSHIIRAVPVAGSINAGEPILGLTSLGQQFRDLNDNDALDAGEEGWD